MGRICRECRKGRLKVLGLGSYGDTIEVECMNPECGDVYEVEMDGLGDAGLEAEEAYIAEQKRKQEDEEEEEEGSQDAEEQEPPVPHR